MVGRWSGTSLGQQNRLNSCVLAIKGLEYNCWKQRNDHRSSDSSCHAYKQQTVKHNKHIEKETQNQTRTMAYTVDSAKYRTTQKRVTIFSILKSV